jgi:hypothetical protein
MAHFSPSSPLDDLKSLPRWRWKLIAAHSHIRKSFASSSEDNFVTLLTFVTFLHRFGEWTAVVGFNLIK